jgi:hypothetical protein
MFYILLPRILIVDTIDFFLFRLNIRLIQNINFNIQNYNSCLNFI